MKIDKELENQLVAKYRTDFFETDDIDLKEIDELITNDELKAIIYLNNTEMCRLINRKPINKEYLRRLLIANLNFYKLAKVRQITVHGSSLLMTIASMADYDVEKVYAELTAGYYNRPYNMR